MTLRPPTSQSSALWQLVSLVVDQGWHVNTSGPPPYWPTELSDDHNLLRPSGSLRLSERRRHRPSRSRSTCLQIWGTTWSGLPMPTGFLPTGHLSCPTDQVCGVGGSQGGKPAFAKTIDGGHRWEVVPMGGPDPLQHLVCRSAAVCVGVLGSAGLGTQSTSSSIVRTDDGGASWTSTSVPISGTVLALSCAPLTKCASPWVTRGSSTRYFRKWICSQIGRRRAKLDNGIAPAELWICSAPTLLGILR